MGRKGIQAVLTMLMVALLAIPAVVQAKMGATCATGMCSLGDETNTTPVLIALLIAAIVIALVLIISKLRKKG